MSNLIISKVIYYVELSFLLALYNKHVLNNIEYIIQICAEHKYSTLQGFPKVLHSRHEKGVTLNTALIKSFM